MESFFNADFFKGNRQKLREQFPGTAPIVLTAHGLLQRNGSMNYPFRQDSNFWYLTGINEPDIILVMDKQKEYLIVSERETIRAAFDGAIDNEALINRSGITTILNQREGWRQLSGRLKRVKHVATLAPPPAYIEAHGLYSNPARWRLVSQLREINGSLELLDLRQHLAVMRMIKQSQELGAIQAAIDITAKALKRVSHKGFNQFDREYEIEAALTSGFRKQGALGHAFTPIVASGQNACTIHYSSNNASLNRKGLLIIDVGAEVEHYAADITRTYTLSNPTKRQRNVYDAVLAVQEFAMANLKLGIIMKEYEKTVEAFMGEKLRELGLIKSAENGAIRQYFPHATSHHLGLDAHDSADYERPLEAGAVLTVEPGIYIPAEGIGVRLEDDVLLHKDGVKTLSARLPRILSGKM